MLKLTAIRQRLTNDPRLARIVHGSASALAGRGIGLLVSIITLPLTVHYLGKLEYGIWVTVSTSILMLAALDLGLANTLTNFISEAYAENDHEKAQVYLSAAFWLTAAIAGVLGIACWVGWARADWGSIFHLTDAALIHRVKDCLALATLFFLVSMPLNLANRVLGGYQQVHLGNYVAMANNVTGLVAVLLVIACKGTIVMLTLAYCGSTLLGTLGLNVWLYFWDKPWLFPVPWKVRRPVARALFGQGFLFFIIQITGLVVFYSDNIVITHYLGAADVTPYSIAYRFTSYASLLQGLLVPSVWPALAEAYQKNDLTWVRATYAAINRKSLQAVGIVAILMGLTGRTIIRLWAGPATVPGYTLLWLMALFAFVISVTTNQALLLSAAGRLRIEAAAAVLAAIANLTASIYLVQRIGSEGVILSSILSFVLLMYAPQAWEVRRVLAGLYRNTTQP